LCDYLGAVIGADRVFIDVEDIAPASDPAAARLLTRECLQTTASRFTQKTTCWLTAVRQLLCLQ
jgi:hypothetical protein